MKEFIKSAVLICLILSAVFLASRAWIYDAVLLRKTDSPDTAYYGKTELHTAAWPVMACMTEGGNRQGLRQDFSALTGMYDRAGAQLGIALGTAYEVGTVTRSEWENELSKDSVYFQFSGAIPAQAVAAWLSVSVSDVISMDILRLALVDDDGRLRLLLQDGGGTLISCKTSVNFDSNLLEKADFPWEACRFAFEKEDLPDGFDGDNLLFGAAKEAPLALISQPDDLKGLSDTLLTGLGISPRTTTHYTETDGSEVYVEGLRTLRVSPDGEIVYRDPSAEGEAADYTESEFIERARALISSAEPWLGDIKLPLTAAYMNGDRFVTQFSYELGCLPVDLPPAGTVSFQNGTIVEARLYLRNIVHTDAPPPAVLPESRVMQLMSLDGDSDGGRFGLMYFEDNGVLTPDWAVY